MFSKTHWKTELTLSEHAKPETNISARGVGSAAPNLQPQPSIAISLTTRMTDALHPQHTFRVEADGSRGGGHVEPRVGGAPVLWIGSSTSHSRRDKPV